MTTKELKIVNGPSATALIDALKYAYGAGQMEVDFTIADGKEERVFSARILGVLHESDNANDFIVYAMLRSLDKPSRSVEMHYDSRQRKGTVTRYKIHS